MAASRSLLVIALVALLCAGAVAERQLLKSSKGKKFSCSKAFPGCAKNGCVLDDASGEYFCETCADANAVWSDDAGKCVCDTAEGYGTISKAQWWKYVKAQKAAKGGKGYKGSKHYGKYGKACVACADYELEALDDGTCGLLE